MPASAETQLTLACGLLALAVLVLLVRRYSLGPFWPAVGYGFGFFALLIFTRSKVSNFSGGLAVGVMAYVLFRFWDDARSGVGPWAPFLLTFAIPPVGITVANRVYAFVASL